MSQDRSRQVSEKSITLPCPSPLGTLGNEVAGHALDRHSINARLFNADEVAKQDCSRLTQPSSIGSISLSWWCRAAKFKEQDAKSSRRAREQAPIAVSATVAARHCGTTYPGMRLAAEHAGPLRQDWAVDRGFKQSGQFTGEFGVSRRILLELL